MAAPSLYYSLPPALKSLAATSYGWKLRRRRYSSRTDELVAQAEARETWSAEQWREFQQARLDQLLLKAASHVPHYRDVWSGRTASTNLQDWPMLDKESVRRRPRSFLSDDANLRSLIEEHTSGTSGSPLPVWTNQETQRSWYALTERRWRRWYGISRLDRWAILGGQLVVAATQKQPPFWVWNGALNQLYLSSYHLSGSSASSYVDAMQRHGVRYLYAYSSAAHSLAQLAGGGAKDIGLKVVITNAEPLYEHQREAIESAFGCLARESYGMSEMVAGASECEAGKLHLWPDAGIVEVLQRDGAAPDGEVGDLVCTGLLNETMPLIRYRLGDRGAVEYPVNPCDCGRTLPVLSHLDGRADDMLILADGRRIGRLDPVFKADLCIREAQIVQESASSFRVRVVAAEGFNDHCAAEITRRLRERDGEGKIEIERVASIPRSANGKFRAVVRAIDGERAH